MKICNICKEEKEDTSFPTIKRKDYVGLSFYCRDCKRIYDRKYWKTNAIKLRARKKINSNIIFDRNIKYVVSFLKANPCVDCGETNPVVLEFDHDSDKIENVSQLVINGVSTETIQKEIEKCTVRCANCHRIKTAKERNYRILKFLD